MVSGSLRILPLPCVSNPERIAFDVPDCFSRGTCFGVALFGTVFAGEAL